jgi:hypothetical protein
MCALLQPKSNIAIDTILFIGIDANGTHTYKPLNDVDNSLRQFLAVLLGEQYREHADFRRRVLHMVAAPDRKVSANTDQCANMRTSARERHFGPENVYARDFRKNTRRLCIEGLEHEGCIDSACVEGIRWLVGNVRLLGRDDDTKQIKRVSIVTTWCSKQLEDTCVV